MHKDHGASLCVVSTVGSDTGQVVQSFQMLLYQRGGAFFDADANLVLDSQEAEETLRFLCEGLRTGPATSRCSSWPDSRTCRGSCTRRAALDGAGRLRTFTTVTLPALKPVTAFVVVTSFIGAAQIFEEPYLLTGGGPAESTLSVTMFIYRAAFQRQQFGYAAAAVVLFVLVFGLSQLFNRLLGIGRASA
ncbi:ABC transporter permease subunit [Streptomyces sp. NPDC102405]|uniref:carbohydrate ABC transporter permease n=1 Tax=Streptomyces sp. NPDC102405 TaxID=3366170 RepID=UPI00382AEE59